MEPLIALVVGFLAARLVGVLGVDAVDAWQPALLVGVAVMFRCVYNDLPAGVRIAAAAPSPEPSPCTTTTTPR